MTDESFISSNQDSKMSEDYLEKDSEGVKHRLSNYLTNKRDEITNSTEGLKHYMEEQKKKHEEQMKKSRDEIASLRATLGQLKEQANSSKKTMDSRQEKMKTMRDLLGEINQEADGILKEKESMEKQLHDNQSLLETERKLLKDQEKISEERRGELDKAAQFFKDRLGMQFKKISGNRLQIIFTNIDQKDPSRMFFFNVKIEGNEKYEITECEPSVAGLEDLVQKLNETNNFRSFVITIRKLFVSSC